MEKERELELGEKLNEQRKVLEGEHAEALRGMDEMHLEGCGPDSFCSTCQAHVGEELAKDVELVFLNNTRNSGWVDGLVEVTGRHWVPGVCSDSCPLSW